MASLLPSAAAAGPLAGRHLVLGLTGGIAAYKAAALCRALVKAGATVQVVMTASAQEFVGTTTLQALSGRKVATSLWDGREPNAMPHINLSRDADAIVVAPASANFLAHVAHGIADDLLTTLCIGRTCPLLVAPAMNVEMWSAAPTQRNLRTLLHDGVKIFGPAEGDQACGEVGMGRMLEPDELLDDIVAFFAPKVLAGRRVLVTAGPTIEPIDPVRVIANRSSGKMGFAIAQAARDAGGEVTLVAGPVALATPRHVTRVDVETAREMHAAVLSRVDGCDAFFAVAAVADWRVEPPAAAKLKKSAGMPALAFAQNPDILADVAVRADAPFCVGFAAETGDLEREAGEKRARKGVPLLVANLGPDTFGREDNEVVLIDAHGATRWPRAPKSEIARRVIAEVARRLPPRSPR